MSHPNIAALLTVFLERYQDLETAFSDLLTKRNIYTAFGAQLDAIGRLVGMPRNGLSDADYQRYLFAQISTNRSDGLIEDLISIALLVLNDPAAVVTVQNEGPAGVSVQIKSTTVDDATANILLDFLLRAKLAGVDLVLLTQYVSDDVSWRFARFASASGALSIGNTTILVDSTTGFPSTGTLIIDAGVAAQETVTYTGKTATAFLGVSALTANHVIASGVTLTTASGAGMGDTSDPTIGGQLASARDAAYTP